jgi:predicted DNA-binding ribbon-helix-helix protein
MTRPKKSKTAKIARGAAGKGTEATTTRTIRLPVRLFQRLEEMATADNRSLNNLVNLILEDYVRTNPETPPVEEQELRTLVERAVRKILADRNTPSSAESDIKA